MSTPHAVCFYGDRVLLKRNTQQFILPLHAVDTTKLSIRHQLSFSYQQSFIHAIALDSEIAEDPDFVLISARDILKIAENIEQSQLLCRSKQLLTWHHHSLYCGHCGHATQMSTIELCKICEQCQTSIYPSTSPAIIVLIQHQDKILLGRSAHFPAGMYSALAGFVEAGESCEETVMREVKEEINIQIKNIRYFGSQSWPFPNSFMIGFLADYDQGQISINQAELEDAQWFDKQHLPLIPPPFSIARQMIDHCIK